MSETKATDPTDDERPNEEKTIAVREAEILELFSESGTAVGVDTVADNLDENPEDIGWLMEDLERRGELRSLPVMYERVP